VVFLHRQYSLRPYERRLLAATHGHPIDLWTRDDAGQPHGACGCMCAREGGPLHAHARWTAIVRPTHAAVVAGAVRGLDEARAAGTLLEVLFVSVSEYLFLLRSAAVALAPLGTRALLYLAAAVSDFYLPDDHTVRASVAVFVYLRHCA
jgi:hypothetical protein